MSRRLVALNLVLAAMATLLIVYIVKELTAPVPLPVGGRRTAGPAAAAATADMSRPPASAYTMVAAKNLFSPTRTEAPSSGLASAAPIVKPNLYGVVVREKDSIAYLEDPLTKRVAGYRVGDRIQGGTVQTIKSDGIVIDSPSGPMDVRLREPSRPRAQPAAAPTPTPATATPALPGVIPPAPTTASPPVAAGQPGVVPPVGQPPSVVVPGAQPGTIAPPIIPGRRPLPPNLLRRLPPGTGDAPQQ
jgi:hypothetical protein